MGFLALVYGLIAYAVFLASFLYAIGFMGNFLVPKGIDSGTPGALGAAVVTNLILLSIFAVQHTIMARPQFKAAWTKVVPRSIERSTFVLFTSLILFLIFWKWQPIRGEVWNFSGALATAMWVLCAAGWFVVLLSTFLINHFDLFGLRQVFLRLRNVEYTKPHFRETSLYRYVRHPIMLGFVIAFWATPHMTGSHFFFAAVTTAYILVGTRFEEKDLVAEHGEKYEQYRRRVPMILPIGGKKVK